jgi:hypothetical protein
VEPPSSQVQQDESQVHGDDHGRGFDQGGELSDEAQEDTPQVEDDDDGPIHLVDLNLSFGICGHLLNLSFGSCGI